MYVTSSSLVSHSSEDNTWEPEGNLDCPELIQAFEDSVKQPQVELTTGATTTSEKEKPVLEDNRPRGFKRGLEVDRIIGATDACGELMFLLMFKDCQEADLIPATLANQKCPEAVIKYYERKKIWQPQALKRTE